MPELVSILLDREVDQAETGVSQHLLSSNAHLDTLRHSPCGIRVPFHLAINSATYLGRTPNADFNHHVR